MEYDDYAVINNVYDISSPTNPNFKILDITEQ